MKKAEYIIERAEQKMRCATEKEMIERIKQLEEYVEKLESTLEEVHGLNKELETELSNADYERNKAVSELETELEQTRQECLEQARLNGMGAERELALQAKLDRAMKEIEKVDIGAADE